MSPQLQNVSEVVKQVRRRIRMRNALRGAAITLAVGALSLLLVALAAGLLKQKHSLVLMMLRVLPFAFSGIAAWLFVARPLRAKLNDAQIARLIEEKCELEDRLVTAVEYSDDPREASPAIVDRLVNDASRRSSAIDIDRVIDPRYGYAYGATAALILFGLIGALLLTPKASKGLAALYAGDGESVSASSMFISVSPGTTKVPRGSDLKIKATLAGFDSMIAQVFMRKTGADNWMATTMEPGKNPGEFQFVIFNVQDSANYYVEAKDIRSNEFALEVADLPFVKQIDLVLDFPAYTHLASKKIENGAEVAALKGTVVQVIAHLSADAKAARIVLTTARKPKWLRAITTHSWASSPSSRTVHIALS